MKWSKSSIKVLLYYSKRQVPKPIDITQKTNLED